MFNLDEVPMKRKIIACIIVALPVVYYLLNDEKSKDASLLQIVWHGACFLFMIAFVAGVIAAALILIYILVLFLGRLLLGAKPENSLESLVSVGYISIGISIIILYYLAFGGRIPHLVW